MDSEPAESLPQQGEHCRQDARLTYLEALDVSTSQKVILLALVALVPESTQPLEAALERLESLTGLKRQTIRTHLRALTTLGILANLQISDGRVRADLTFHVPEIRSEPELTAATNPTPSLQEAEYAVSANTPPLRTDSLHGQPIVIVEHEPPVQTAPSNTPLQESAPPRRRAEEQQRNPIRLLFALTPEATNGLTPVLAIFALVLLVYTLTTGTREFTSHFLGWGGLVIVATSVHIAYRGRDRYATRGAHLGWAAILAGSLHLLVGQLS